MFSLDMNGFDSFFSRLDDTIQFLRRYIAAFPE